MGLAAAVWRCEVLFRDVQSAEAGGAAWIREGEALEEGA
jgi:hypothetical protein